MPEVKPPKISIYSRIKILRWHHKIVIVAVLVIAFFALTNTSFEIEIRKTLFKKSYYVIYEVSGKKFDLSIEQFEGGKPNYPAMKQFIYNGLKEKVKDIKPEHIVIIKAERYD